MKTVYEMVNVENGMSYVGSTTLPIEDRFCQHLGYARVSGKISKSPLSEAIREYGSDSFICHPLTVPIYDNRIANNLEQYFIKTKHSHVSDNGYNVDYSEIRAKEGARYASEFIDCNPTTIQLAKFGNAIDTNDRTIYPRDYLATRNNAPQQTSFQGLGYPTEGIQMQNPTVVPKQKTQLYHLVDNSIPYAEYKKMYAAV